MKKGYKKFPLVEIRWIDHSGEAGWVELDDLDEPPIECRTVGWLVHLDNMRFHVMNTLSNDKGQGGNSEILKTCVTKFKVLRKSF